MFKLRNKIIMMWKCKEVKETIGWNNCSFLLKVGADWLNPSWWMHHLHMSALCCICTVLMWLFLKAPVLQPGCWLSQCGSPLLLPHNSKRGGDTPGGRGVPTCSWPASLWCCHSYLPEDDMERMCRRLQKKQSLQFFTSRGKKDWIKLNYFYVLRLVRIWSAKLVLEEQK